VREAAAALSFTPNFFAQALNSQRTGTIGMVTSDLDNRFVLPVLLGAEDAFGSGSLSVLLADARDDALREQLHLQNLLTRRVDGLLIVGRTTNPRPPAPVLADVPVVYVYAPSTDPTDASFTPDNVQAGRLAAERETGRAGQAQHLTATEIDGECLGQHSVIVSTPGGRRATFRPPGGGLRVTGL
jgi:LacI family transcriptional regulator